MRNYLTMLLARDWIGFVHGQKSKDGNKEHPLFVYKHDIDLRSFNPRIHCPYCNSLTQSLHEEAQNVSVIDYQSDELCYCPDCGWWCFAHLEENSGASQVISYTRSAVLQKYSLSSADVPIEPLISYLIKHGDRLKHVDPIRFEATIASLLSELMGCKIEFCSYGRPDKGIDIILAQTYSGDKFAIQVKRYQKPIELQLIHAFHGALVSSDFTRGIFVTSSKFRKGCFQEASVLRNKTGIEIDFIDGKRILEFMGIWRASLKSDAEKICPYWHSRGFYELTGLGSTG